MKIPVAFCAPCWYDAVEKVASPGAQRVR